MIATTATPLEHAINGAIAACVKSNRRISGQSEPNHVARLVAGFPDILVKAWSPFLGKGSMYVQSAFCHSVPRVTWASPFRDRDRNPELADLLLTVQSTRAGITHEMALLLQVKMEYKGTFHISGEGPHAQRYMFARWPRFRIKGEPVTQPLPPTYIRQNSQLYIGRGNKKDKWTRYASVDPFHAIPWKVEAAPASWTTKHRKGGHAISFATCSIKKFRARQSLASVLVDMSNHALGRPANQDDDWSYVVDYLLNHAFLLNGTSGLNHVSHTARSRVIGAASASAFLTDSLSRGQLVDDWCRVRWSAGFHGKTFSRIPYNEGRMYSHCTSADDFDFNGGFGAIRIVLTYEEQGSR